MLKQSTENLVILALKVALLFEILALLPCLLMLLYDSGIRFPRILDYNEQGQHLLYGQWLLSTPQFIVYSCSTALAILITALVLWKTTRHWFKP